MLKEKLITALHRDRLETFLKDSAEQKSGCFYYALLTCWEHLNPGKILPRDISAQILNINQDLGVRPTEVIPTVQHLQEKLGLKVIKIDITKSVIQDVSQIQEEFSFPPELSVEKKTSNRADPLTNQSSGIIYWLANRRAHFTSMHQSSRFDELEEENGNAGGQAAVDLALAAELTPIFVFHVDKT